MEPLYLQMGRLILILGLLLGLVVACVDKSEDEKSATNNHVDSTGDTDSGADIASNPEGATAVVTGDERSCALLGDATVSCWGDDSNGLVGGYPGETVSARPNPIEGLDGAIAISSDDCAILRDHTIECWGRPSETSGDAAPPLPPFALNGIEDAVSISGACALLKDGTVQCWDDDEVTPVVEIPGGTQLASFVYSEIWCVLHQEGDVYCWGTNDVGQLGDGTTGDRSEPAVVSDIADAVDVSVGCRHACAVREGGEVWCWGANYDGQLGDYTSYQAPRPLPASVIDIDSAVAVACGCRHSCAVLSDGTVKCWGDNTEGQLGNGGESPDCGSTSSIMPEDPHCSVTPVEAIGVTGTYQLSASYAHTCAVSRDGIIHCWGENVYGQLGNGSYSGSNVPVPVEGL